MRLLIAEKPSVARDLARVLGATAKKEGYLEGNGLRVTWCFGHMCELEEPSHYDGAWKRWSLDTLPMLPEQFALKVRKGAKEQFAVLRRLLRDREVGEVVNCCDAGREGELIFRYVYDVAGCTRPVSRLWISSLTDTAIRQGWAALRPGQQYDALGDAARCRSEADWLVGLNATRALTCRSRQGDGEGGALLSLGRVQTPTLAMIVGRDLEIEAFVPETFWRVTATFDAPGHTPDRWVGAWFRGQTEPEKPDADGSDEDETPTGERLPSEAHAKAVAAAVAGRIGSIEVAKRRRTRERPPLLYDLTALQRRANQRYGMSAQRTLEIAQDLYEKHKLITYPRTDARYLTPDQVPGLADVVRGLLPIPAYAPFCQGLLAAPIQPGSRVVNAAEVGDHHAILPTGRTPSTDRLSADEKRVFDLVARRLLAALSADAQFDVTELIARVPTDAPLPEGLASPLRFRARGRVCVEAGWRAVDPPGPSKETDLPGVQLGDPAPVRATDAREGQTRPPRPHTDASILQGMERAGKLLDDDELARAMRGCGLGTPATRAAILQTLIDRGYVERQQRTLRATDKGRGLIAAVTVDELKSPELTGRWEGRLTDIAEGRARRADFMRDVADHTRRIVDAIRQAPPPAVAADPKRAPSRSLGSCPVCGKPVRRRGTVWSCDTGRACPFVVFEVVAGKKVPEKLVRQLVKDGRTELADGFESKAGKKFSAGLAWDPEKGKVSLWFPERDAPRGAAEGESCPTCGTGRVIRGRTALGCSRWREGCGFRAPLA